ncbi:MAG: hypothetical protein VKN83_06265 [Cyanobacteriota bacterium]|jgi:hypothetical protein|nr:hypothetical protein [Cyanobacteriota bacterium]
MSHTPRQPSGLNALVLGLLSTLPLGLASPQLPAAAQQAGYGQTMGTSPAESQIYNYDPASGSRTGGGSGGLNPTNPLDLINKIRKGTAMDDATPPGDAIDQALKDLEAQTGPQAGAKPVSPVVTSPRPSGAAATP